MEEHENNKEIDMQAQSAETQKNHEEQDLEERSFKWTKDRIILAVIFAAIMLISIALLVVVIVDKDFLFNIVRNYFVEPIKGLHIALQITIFLLLMMLQSLLIPIPSELILLSGGILFGITIGSIVGVVGSMMSAAVTFYLSKRGGRSIIDASGEKVSIIKRTTYIFDQWIKTWGLWAIIVGRAVPFIMFDPISYAAGLAEVKDKHYFLATFIGSIPRAIFYSFIGVKMLGEIPTDPSEVDAVIKQFNTWFFVVFGILVFMFILSNIIYYVHQKKKKKEGELTKATVEITQEEKKGEKETKTETPTSPVSEETKAVVGTSE
ncbi:MAG: TVP38/TMEM64 family protein [Candidatus Heimdallarchaeota archaeon]